MPLNKASGNMYGWVTHTHSPLGGACPLDCDYCYTKAMRKFPSVAAKYAGPPRLIEAELNVHYGSGRTIFIEHMSDLFSPEVPAEMIGRVLTHCAEWPENTYVFQTKNPARFLDFLSVFPPTVILGTTIETNRDTSEISRAPAPKARYDAMTEIRRRTTAPIFVTAEPLLKFDLEEFASWIVALKPDFLNIGADSKNSGLTEPTSAEVRPKIRRNSAVKNGRKGRVLYSLPNSCGKRGASRNCSRRFGAGDYQFPYL